MFIFDAKYRFSFDAEYEQNYAGIGPKVEDINTMHRYRDAIVAVAPLGVPVGFSRVVKGAVVMFPYQDEAKFTEHRFFKSIAKVQIGGLPFLPTATRMVTEKLYAELLDSGFAIERIPDGQT